MSETILPESLKQDALEAEARIRKPELDDAFDLAQIASTAEVARDVGAAGVELQRSEVETVEPNTSAQKTTATEKSRDSVEDQPQVIEEPPKAIDSTPRVKHKPSREEPSDPIEAVRSYELETIQHDGVLDAELVAALVRETEDVLANLSKEAREDAAKKVIEARRKREAEAAKEEPSDQDALERKVKAQSLVSQHARPSSVLRENIAGVK